VNSEVRSARLTRRHGHIRKAITSDEFGEEGRAYFHAVSQFHPGYDRGEADGKFDHALKGEYQEITIGTFVWGVKFFL